MSSDISECNFGPASPDKSIVYGACRPGYTTTPSAEAVHSWLDIMAEHGIERVVCLLDDQHLRQYDDLLHTYHERFGAENVCHAPIADYSLVDPALLADRILPFLVESERADKPVVVHCSAGSGRTGHVLAAWVAVHSGVDAATAVETVRAMGRRPLEACTLEEFEALLKHL